jgi:hypothetical protein
MSEPRERWTFVFELPPDVGKHSGRFVARLLKHLLRVWRVKCVANAVTPPPETEGGTDPDPNDERRPR